MRRAILTVGLGFGDEAKGATVDFLARAFEADLVVRYCGGGQAGHNVELPDGRRHTFSQFGAGTLAGARTFLGPAMVIDPPALRREADHLVELGVADPFGSLTVHPDCLVTTAWHRAMNRARELARGAARHGSCGQGVGEARSYWLRHGADAPVAADLRETGRLRAKLELLRQRVLLEVQPLLPRLDEADRASLDLGLDADTEARHLEMVGDIAAEPPAWRTAVFEGAQGVLLDEYRGFHPYTTWSTVTPHHAWELVDRLAVDAVAVLGLTRAYTTRHGAGPLPTFSAGLTERLGDPGNPWNAWQGHLRCGWLDLPLLRYAAACVVRLDGVGVSHLDQVAADAQVCEAYRSGPLVPASVPDLAWQEGLTRALETAEPAFVATDRDSLLARVADLAPVLLTADGPSHADRRLAGLRFRRRRAG